MAMAIAIVNQALARLGEPSIQSLSGTDATSIRCAALYSDTVLETLSMHPWPCARKRAALSQITLSTIMSSDDIDGLGYSYGYSVPSDCIMVLGTAAGNNYMIEGRYLYSNDEGVVLIYICNPGEAYMDPLLASAIGLRLASKLAIDITADQAKMQALLQEFTIILETAANQTIVHSQGRSRIKTWADR